MPHQKGGHTCSTVRTPQQRWLVEPRVHGWPGAPPRLRQISCLAQGTTKLKTRGAPCPRLSRPVEVPGSPHCVPGQESVTALMQESVCLTVSASLAESFLCSDVVTWINGDVTAHPPSDQGSYRNQREGALCNRPRLACVGTAASPQMRENSRPCALENSHQINSIST